MIYVGEENFTKSFLRIIDNDADGILTLKEMKAFDACPEYDGKKLMREFKEYGRKADLNELSTFLTPKAGNGSSIQSSLWSRNVQETSRMPPTPNISRT